ncbi:MAG: TldD/PmbA family protein, partial [Planctomycetota bacterium]
MNKQMHDLAAWSIKTAKAAAADDCRVEISSRRFVEVSYRQRKPENLKEASTRSLNIEIYVNHRYSSQRTSDLRQDALRNFISNAVVTTKLLAEDPYRTLPDPKYYEGRADIDLGIRDANYEKLTPESRHALVKAIEAVSLAKGGEKVISVIAGASDSHGESVMLTSNGFEGYREYTTYSAGAEITVQDDGDRRPNGYHYVTSVKKERIPSAEEIGTIAAKRTLDLLGGMKIQTETLPVIIENRAVPGLLWGLLSPMFGGTIQQKQSCLADKKGQKIASDVMIESGVLKEFFIDWYYGRKLDWEPTTGEPSNLIIPPGHRSVQEIMKDLGRGIFVTDFIGGNSNPTTGDTSIGIIGHLFENGVPTQAVAEMNIADNHLKFWHKLTEVANDPWIYSS